MTTSATGAPPRRRAPVWLLVSAAWLAPGILAAFQAWAQGRLGGDPTPPERILWQGGDWLLYAGLTPLVFWISRRIPLERETIARYLPLHLLASVLVTAIWAAAGVALHLLLFREPPYGQPALSWFFTSLPFGVPVYFAVLGVERAATFFVRARDREALLVEARLNALRMQMQPHFLLNSLNALTVVVRDRDTATATHLLEQLGAILRRVIRSGGPAEVPLSDEIDFVRQYLAIEQIRFGDRLRVTIDVPDALTRARVPDLILQPLVENAIRHGLARRVGTTELGIEARRDGDSLVITVRDEGEAERDVEIERGAGVGLRNARERLVTLYGERATLSLTVEKDRTVVTIRMPYQTVTDER